MSLELCALQHRSPGKIALGMPGPVRSEHRLRLGNGTLRLGHCLAVVVAFLVACVQSPAQASAFGLPGGGGMAAPEAGERKSVRLPPTELDRPIAEPRYDWHSLAVFTIPDGSEVYESEGDEEHEPFSMLAVALHPPGRPPLLAVLRAPFPSASPGAGQRVSWRLPLPRGPPPRGSLG